MKLRKFQQGGEAPAPAQGQSAQPNQQASPEEQLMAMAQQIIQQLGPEASAALAEMIMQMLQQMQQQTQPQGTPQYQKKGGKLVYMGRK